LIAAIQNADTSQIKGLQERLLSATTLSQRIVDQLKERFEGTDDPLVREALAKLLTSIDVQDDAMGDFFLRQARLDASVPVRRLLVDGLLNHPSVGSEDLLRQILLQEDDTIVKIKAIDALGVLRSDKAVEVLRTVALADKNDDVKLETIRVLTELGDPDLIQSCLDIIRSRTEKFDVQQGALDTVDKMPDRDAKKQVLESLTGDGTPRPEIRARAKALYLKASGDH
jgi:hypothetical protein